MKEILEEAGATVKLQEQLRTAEETAIVEDWNNISTLKKCPEYDKQVSREAKDCPHCGHPLFRYDYKALFLRLLKLVMIILILWFIIIPVGWWLIKFVFKFMFIDAITG